MPRKQYMYHYTYKTTNLINGKYYLGMHSTNNLNDGYLGSGVILWKAINKYGKENFKLEILSFYNNRKELKNKEAELITEQILIDPMCMNLAVGGNNGFDYINDKRKKNPEYDKWFRNLQGSKMKQYHKEGKIRYDTFTGKQHSKKSKNKMRKSALGKHEGSKNGSFGTCWVYNETKSIKIKKEELEKYLKDGWLKGRKIKYVPVA